MSASAESADHSRFQAPLLLHLRPSVGEIILPKLVMHFSLTNTEFESKNRPIGGKTNPANSFFIDSRQSPRTDEWNYSEQLEWSRKHRDCSLRAQSPIDIQQRNVIISQHLRLHFYNYNRQLKFKLANAHHTIKLNPILPGQGEGAHGAGGSEAPNSTLASLDDLISADGYVDFVHPPGLARPQQQQQQSPSAGSPASTSDGRQRQHGSGRLRLGSPPPIGAKNQSHGLEGAQQAVRGATQKAGNEVDENEPEVLPYDGAPSIKLGWLDDGNNEFKLRDIHFHWGERRDNGSEHAVEGRRAAMEVSFG